MSNLDNEEVFEELCPNCGEVYWEDFPVCMDCENRAEIELAQYEE